MEIGIIKEDRGFGTKVKDNRKPKACPPLLIIRQCDVVVKRVPRNPC